MAWTTPITFVAGNPLLAAELNVVMANMNALKGPPSDVANINEASDYSTSSTSWVDVDATDLSLTIVTTGGDVQVTFYCNCIAATACAVYFSVVLDGVAFPADDGAIAQYLDRSAAPGRPIAFTWWTDGLSAGSHQFKIAWKVSANTAVMYAGAGTGGGDLHPQFTAREVS